ncbi:MAG: sensor histidine kinase [Eubacteriales bacterium]
MKKTEREKSGLSKKLLLAFLGALVAIVMAVSFVGSVLLLPLDSDVRMQALYLSQLIILILIIIAFYCIIDRMIVRRIKALNGAMQEVAKGDYEITVPSEKEDEISGLTDSFNKMTAELKSNAFLSRDFTRYVSHEFKTPLSVIRSHAEAAQYARTKEEANQYLEVVISETDRLAGISKNIMELCRLDSTTFVPKEDTFSPASQIRTVILSAQLVWTGKNITVEPELEEFEIKSNESLLFRVWENLIGNAIKFTGENGNIAVILKKRDGRMVFEVADDGVGITDEDKDKIFDPFFTGDRSHNGEGSGLGLPLTKKIAEKLGGTVRFTSERNKGSTFTVEIPL